MKTTSKKLLSILLAITMIFSTVVAASAAVTGDKITADPTTNLIQGYVGNGSINADKISSNLLLDLVDEKLKELDLNSLVNENLPSAAVSALKLMGITIKLNSVNEMLDTLNKIAKHRLVNTLLKAFGDLKDLNLSVFKTKYTRGADSDLTILNVVVQFAADNKSIVKKFVAGNLNTGIDAANDAINDVLGPDGVYGKIKEILAGVVYEEGSAQYNTAKAKTVDKIIFEDMMTVGLDSLLKKADDTIKGKWVDVDDPNEVWAYLYGQGFKFEGALSAFKFDNSLNFDKLIASLANAIWNYAKTYIPAMLAEYGDDINAWLAGNEYAAPFAKFIDFTNEINLDFTSTSVKDINKFFGQILAGIAPSYTNWNNSANLGKNLEDLFVWGLKNRDVTENDPYAGIDTSSFAKCALSLAKIIVRINVKDDAVIAQMDACTSATQVITKLLPYLLNRDASIVSSKSTTWQTVLGDIAGYYLKDFVPLYTNSANTKMYAPSSSTSIWDVLNYAANFYMVDLNLDALFGLEMTKSESFLSKVDKLQGVLCGSTIAYTKASTYLPDLIEHILSLDLNTIIKDDIESVFIDKNTSFTASQLVFTFLDNTIKALVGQSIFASGTFSSIDALLKNSALGASAEKLLDGLNNKKGTILPIVLYFLSTLTDKWNFEVTIGDNNAVTVKFGGKTLVKDTDFTVSSKVNVKGKSALVTVKGKGEYSGTVTGVSACTSHSYGSAKCTTKADATKKKAGVNTYTCTRCGATKTSSIAYPKTLTAAKTAVWTGKAIKPTVTVKDSAGKEIAAKNYTVAYAKNTNVGTATITVTFKGNYTGKLTATFNILPAQVKGLKASKITNTSITLTWTKVTGAKYYKVEQSLDGKKWTVVKDNVTANTLTISKLKANTKYQFRVTAKDSTKKLIGKASAVLKTGTATNATTVKLTSSKSKTVVAKWTKVTGATKYTIYKSTDGKKFTKVTTTKNAKTLSYTFKKLSGGKKFYVKVAAVNAYGSTESKVVSITVKK